MKKRVLFFFVFFIIIIIGVSMNNASSNEKICFCYLFGNYDYIDLISRNKDSINYVSPSYFDLDEFGNLIVNDIDEKLLVYLKENKIKITPFLSNHWDREKGRKAISNAEKLSGDIVTMINKYGFDGVNIDLENLTSSDREKYCEFVKLLKEKMPSSKKISVAVSANPNGINSGWQGSYDYKTLSDNADFIIVMAYDEHSEGGSEGAVSSLTFFKKSIEYALSKVNAEKIVIGLPFYGRYWKENEAYGGYGVTSKRIDNIVNMYNSSSYYDENCGCMFSKIVVSKNEEKPIVNGRLLDTGTYHFYYENEKSIEEKIKLVKKYNLKGISSWSLGQETNSMWIAYSKYLPDNNEGFSDINEVSWATEAISDARESGLVYGREEGNYMPNERLTRAEFATMIARMLELETFYDNEVTYEDIGNHWAKASISTLTKTGLFEGYGDGSFRPDNFVTRAEVAKVLSSLIKNDEQNQDVSFTDVDDSLWAKKYILKIAKHGITYGYEDGSFRPNENITRAEVAVMLMRMD